MLFRHEVISNTALNEKFILIKFKSFSSGFKFKVGQFTTIRINQTTFRCYSFASIPEDLPYWEILVDITPGGPGTTYLKSLKVGQSIESLPASGQFELNGKLKKIIFGATGCGMAPFLPMIKMLAKNKNNDVQIFWGLRTEKDVILEKMFNDYSKSNKNMHFEIILSKPSDKWKGKTGHITGEIIKTAKEFSNKNSGIYLSGSNEFISEVCDLLEEEKFPQNKIYHEACY